VITRALKLPKSEVIGRLAVAAARWRQRFLALVQGMDVSKPRTLSGEVMAMSWVGLGLVKPPQPVVSVTCTRFRVNTV